MSKFTIQSFHAREVWDSRGSPTIEVEVTLNGGCTGRAIATSGASVGSFEAPTLYDGGTRLNGRGVKNLVKIINEKKVNLFKGKNAGEQDRIDHILIETETDIPVGSNGKLAISIAVAQAAASANNMPFYKYLANGKAVMLPLPQIQIFGGGVHANNDLDIQDIMVICPQAETFSQTLEWSANIYHNARTIIKSRGMLKGNADLGGLWPVFERPEDGFRIVIEAIENAGLVPGRDVFIATDIAANQLRRKNKYYLRKGTEILNTEQLIEKLINWTKNFPIISLEDPLAEDDNEGFISITKTLNNHIQIIGDDYFATNTQRILQGVELGACNAVLLKPSQIGTLTQTLEALEITRQVGYKAIIGGRSGDTEDTSIMHLAIGWALPQIKIGGFNHSERMAKWNEGLRIEEALGSKARFDGKSIFQKN